MIVSVRQRNETQRRETAKVTALDIDTYDLSQHTYDEVLMDSLLTHGYESLRVDIEARCVSFRV